MQYRQHRHPTDYLVPIKTPQGKVSAKIRDVNHAGACLTGIDGLTRGDKVRLDVLSNTIEAIVLWVHGTRAGIIFRPRISDQMVDIMRRRVDGSIHRTSSFPPYREMR